MSRDAIITEDETKVVSTNSPGKYTTGTDVTVDGEEKRGIDVNVIKMPNGETEDEAPSYDLQQLNLIQELSCKQDRTNELLEFLIAALTGEEEIS